MKRMIFAGLLTLAIGFSPLSAQKKNKKDTQQPAAAAQAQSNGPKVKSKEEAAAVMTLQKAIQDQNADEMIKAAEDLVTRFSDTQFKETAYTVEARAYQSKNDVVNAQVYGEKALEVNPKSYQMTLLVGEVLATHMGEHDFDRAEKMAKATKLFNDSIDNVNAAEKPGPQIPDDQWNQIKKEQIAEAHNGLGLLALNDKKYDVAITEFKTAVDFDPQDAYNTRLASAYLSAGKKTDALAICDKLLANPQLHPQIKSIVNNIKAMASK